MEEIELYAGGMAKFFLRADAAELEAEGEEEDLATPAEVQAFFEVFRDELAENLELEAKFAWSEDPQGASESVKITEKAFGALMIIASRAAIRDKRMNPVSAQRDWFEDPAVEMLQDEEDDFVPVHHLVKADTWIPADFAEIHEADVPDRELLLGSVAQLKAALDDVGQILATPNEVTRKLAPELVADARSAHAAFVKIVAYAAARGVPIMIEP